MHVWLSGHMVLQSMFTMKRKRWDLKFMMQHELQAITVDDGAGKKGVIKRTSKGDFSVQITSNEIL